MLAIQSHQNHERLRGSLRNTYKERKMPSMYRAPTKDEILSLRKRPSWWTNGMSLSMRNPMSDHVDPKEEYHMKLLPRRQRVPKKYATSSEARKFPPKPITRRGGAIYSHARKEDSELASVQGRFAKATIRGEDQPSLEFSESFVRDQHNILARIKEENESARGRNNNNNNHATARRTHPAGRKRSGRIQPIETSIGRNIKLHDQDRVYAALHDGSATVIKCIGCSKHMMVTTDIKLVFCPGCGTLSPITLAQPHRGKAPPLPHASRVL